MIRACIATGLLLTAPVCGASDPEGTLKDAFAGRFWVGVAVSTPMVTRPEPDALALVVRHFDSVTSENAMKWEKTQPLPGEYDFAAGDRFVALGDDGSMKVIGHTLVWHSQTPPWVFQGTNGAEPTREQMLRRMESHIRTVVGRYRGRVHGWDVVNEALAEDGSMRDSPWRRLIGDDYVEQAFRFAHAADPEAELYYNDYNLTKRAKRRGAVRLVESLKQAGCRVDAVGMQGHWRLDWPPLSDVQSSIDAFAAVAGRVTITELDVNVLPWPEGPTGADVATRFERDSKLDPYRAGLPPAQQRALADRYAALFRLFLKNSKVIDRVTLWGLDDGRSWHNDWPVRGRTAHSLLFDRSLRPKLAHQAVVAAAVSDANADR